MSRSPRTAGSPVSCRRASWSGSYTSMMPTGTWSRGAGRITIAWVSQAFARFLDGRAWTHAEGPVTLFEQATGLRRGNIRRLRGGRRALRLVFAVAGVVVVVPAAVVAAARRDAVRQEREPCVVDCADDLVVGVRCLVGDPAVRPADDFLRTLGPAGSHYKYLQCMLAGASVC